jgi:hypothetical protein
MLRRSVIVLALALSSAPLGAQWLGYPAKNIPRNQDGTPNLSAPLPRTADGKPDLSGIWQPAADATDPAGGVEGITGPRYLINILRDSPDVVMQPEAAAVFKQRQANKLRDNPMIKCLPGGLPRMNTYTHPYKIVQIPGLIVVLYESQTMFRQIFMDGRALPVDPEPAWMGYSVGRWDGDVLVVESSGFNGKTWPDGLGHPLSDAMTLTERFRRRDFGHMDVEVIINDPKSYTRPVRYVQPQVLQPDTELIEYICNENAKPVGQ